MLYKGENKALPAMLEEAKVLRGNQCCQVSQGLSNIHLNTVVLFDAEVGCVI